MSSEIYYDRAFIRVGDRFIPVVNHGSSNCFDFDAHGREVPEKHWSVLNYTFHGRQLFTEEEIRQIAAVYEAANSDNRDGIRKSRNRSFGVGEFGRWIMNGMKTAHTVEEYRACGNTVVVVEYTEPIWKKHVVYTTEKLLDKLNDLDGNPISVSFWDDRTVTHPPTRRKNDLLNHNDLTEYYVLRAAQGFFVKRSSRRIWFARKIPPTAASVRKFGTEKAAQRYLDDNAKFLAEARVNKIIKMIRLLGNCSGTGVYEYTDTQAAYIFSALQSELDKAKKRFRKPSLGKHRFSLTDTNEFDDDRPLEPTIALALPDGSYLRAVVYEDDHFPAINIYWDHDGGKASELLCFAEYNSERDEGAQVCIGTYVSDEDETQYYAPYMAERNNEP